MFLEEVIQQPGQREQMLKDALMEALHVAIPCEVLSYNSAERTVKAQPLIRGWNDKGKPPALLDVPVFFAGNLVFDINPGDECLVVFADSCVDGWFQNSGISSPTVSRKHDYSDGFAFVGFTSKRKVTEGIDITEKIRELEQLLITVAGLVVVVEGLVQNALTKNTTWGEVEG